MISNFTDLTKPINDLLGKDFPVGFAKVEVNTSAVNGIVFIY